MNWCCDFIQRENFVAKYNLLEMVNCSVPGCEKINKKHNKRFMFNFPKKKELLQKWVEAIPNLKQPIKSSWRVCQLHFQTEDILESFSHTIGGEVFLIERERPRLKPNVVPTRNLQNYQLETNENRSKKDVLRFDVLKEQPMNTSAVNKRVREEVTIPHNREVAADGFREIVKIIPVEPVAKEKNVRSILSSKQSENSSILREATENCEKGCEIASAHEFSNTTDESADNIQVQEELDENTTYNNSNSLTLIAGDSFELFDSVFEVVLPTTLWGVHRSPQQKRIIFLCIDEEQLNINKMVTVDDTGDLKIYLAGRLIREEHCAANLLTPEYISDVLAELDAMQICYGANLCENCEVVITNFENDEQQLHRVCKKCC